MALFLIIRHEKNNSELILEGFGPNSIIGYMTGAIKDVCDENGNMVDEHGNVITSIEVTTESPAFSSASE